jgi:hypothetical protein
VGLDVGLRGCNFVLVGGVTGRVFSVAENLAADGPNVALLERDADRAIGRIVPGSDRAAAGRETAPCR